MFRTSVALSVLIEFVLNLTSMWFCVTKSLLKSQVQICRLVSVKYKNVVVRLIACPISSDRCLKFLEGYTYTCTLTLYFLVSFIMFFYKYNFLDTQHNLLIIWTFIIHDEILLSQQSYNMSFFTSLTDSFIYICCV